MVKERIPVMWARPCHSCGSPPSPSAAYSHSDGACLCVSCDARLQAANRAAALHQEHLWVCEACEKAPATVTCKADAASLCAACDANIHSANSLARRHHRVPILSISGVPHRGTIDINAGAGVKPDCNKVGHDDEDEAASWLLLNPGKNEASQSNQNGYNLYGREDEYLEGMEQNSTEDQYNKNGDFDQQMQFKNQFSNGEKSNGSDRVVPVQKEHILQDDLEFERNKAGFSYSATSLGNSISLSSMEASIVPDNSMTDNSNSHSRPPKCTIDLFSGPPLEFPAQFAPMDREARVLRYREKRKTRKFEKTIRYASRKAYAETRPRIKGRFAKRTDVETEIDQMFCTTVMEETVYGIVPSFQVL